VVARRPSVATAAFAFYTWGNLPSFRFEELFSWLPDPVYGVSTTAVEALISEFPLFFLLIFVTRFRRSRPRAAGASACGLQMCAVLSDSGSASPSPRSSPFGTTRG